MMLIMGMKKAVQKNEFAVTAMILFLVVVMTIGSNIFWDFNNLNSLQSSVAPNAIVAFGMVMLLILGVFDLSVGATMCLVGSSVSGFLASGMNIPLAVALGIGIGAIIGLVNGVLVSVVRINPLIATIGMQYVLQGIAYISMSSLYQDQTKFPQEFISIGNGKFLGIYYQFWIMMILFIGLTYFLRFTYAGRKMYFIGGNLNAANKMGFSSKRIIVFAYIITGMLSSLAAILSIARYENANRYLGSGVGMAVIIACVLGGASFLGGKGTAFGALLGVIFMTLMTNFFNLFEISSTWQNVVIGTALIIVVAIDGFLTMNKQIGVK